MKNLILAIPDAINSLEKEFTTHQLIIELAQTNQHAYIEALYENLSAKKPFQTLHSKIGKHLRQSDNLVSLIKDDEVDVNIFGRSSKNALWQRSHY